jgi:hypothetical protein
MTLHSVHRLSDGILSLEDPPENWKFIRETGTPKNVSKFRTTELMTTKIFSFPMCHKNENMT